MSKKKTIEKLEISNNPINSIDSENDNEPIQAEKVKPESQLKSKKIVAEPELEPEPEPQPQPKIKRKQTEAQKQTTIKMREKLLLKR